MGETPLVGIVMGSHSDWDTMKKAADMLDELGLPYETRVSSAHRMPDETLEYAESARERGLMAIIAGAGGAAHLGGVIAAKTVLPVLAVPIHTKTLGGLDSLLSMVQMPAGIPVATFAIGNAGAANAALYAAAIIGIKHPEVLHRIEAFRKRRRDAILEQPDPSKAA
jgi:5-(carboxyamino)imidazole ribonucleotide mutase